MAVKRPDVYEHNNPNEPIVHSENVRGGALVTADLDTLLTDFTSKENKLKQGATKVYVISEDADYRLMNIAAIGNIDSWAKVVTGGGDVQIEFADDSETINEAITNKAVNPFGLGKWLANVLQRALTFAETIIFTKAPIFSSLTANNILSLDANKNVESVLQKITPVITSSTIINQLTTESNWNANSVYTGTAIAGANQMQFYADAKYLYYFTDDLTPIRISRHSLLHLVGNSAAPSSSAGTGAGTGASVSVSGNDMGGRISIIAGTSPAANADVVTITVNRPFSGAFQAFIVPRNGTTAALSGVNAVYVRYEDTTKFIIKTDGQLQAGLSYQWNYFIVQ